MPNIKLNINLDKVPDTAHFKGKKGTYLGLVLIENKEGTDQYGNDGFAKIDVSKEDREAGVSGPIVGNWKFLGQGKTERPF